MEEKLLNATLLDSNGFNSNISENPKWLYLHMISVYVRACSVQQAGISHSPGATTSQADNHIHHVSLF